MVVRLKRKLYRRGSSFETTIPQPLLFALDQTKKHHVIFEYDSSTQKWMISFELQKQTSLSPIHKKLSPKK